MKFVPFVVLNPTMKTPFSTRTLRALVMISALWLGTLAGRLPAEVADARLGVTMINVPAVDELGPGEPRTPLARRLELWTALCGGREPAYIQDQLYLPTQRPDDFKREFARWKVRWQDYPHKERLEINVAMFPAKDVRHEEQDFATRSDRYARLLQGEFDSLFDTVAETLVAAGFGRSQIRLAHEFNQFNVNEVEDTITGALVPPGRFAHLVNPESAANMRHFREAWIRIWTRFMKKGRTQRPGAAFQWVWSPLVGDIAWDATGRLPYVIREGTSKEASITSPCYPGDAYVDIIGPDFYEGGGLYFYNAFHPDGSPAVTPAEMELKRELSWRKAVEGKVYSEEPEPKLLFDKYPGLNHYYDFAVSRRKAFRLSEWGVSAKIFPNIPGLTPSGKVVDLGMSSGDNPDFIARMYEWLKTHPRATSACYFEGPFMPWEQSDHSLLDYGWGVANPLSRAKFRELFVEKGFAGVK